MLTPAEVERASRGEALKRAVRSAGAWVGYYDDTDLARELGISPNAVGMWWRGETRPTIERLQAIGALVHLSPDELVRLVYLDGQMPTMRRPVAPDDPRLDELRELEASSGSQPRRPARRPTSGQ